MLRIVAFGTIAALGASLHAQTIHVRGKVSNPAGQPADKAVVELVKAGLKDTTGPDGMYSLTKSGSALRASVAAQGMSLRHGILQVTVARTSALVVEVFDLHGRLLRMESVPEASAGSYSWDFNESRLSDRMMIIKVSLGGDVRTFRHAPGAAGSSAPAAAAFTRAQAFLAKTAAALDTLKVTAPGHPAVRIPLGTLDTLADIALTAAPDVERSAGCGKTPTLKSGNGQSFTPPSGGSARTFNLRIPTDYDNATAYRLVVGLHWLNGTANNVSEGNSGATVKPYYGLWELANPAGSKSTTIFVAPQGIGNGWGNSGGQDVRFITALVEKLAGDLCIDRSRIFAEGFSMGGSMSYALACGAPDMFRGVAAHSGGPMSGCDKTNRKPVAYFMTHGTKDGVCTYPGFGVPQVNDFAQLNGCQAMDIPGTLKPTDNSGMNPACADYKGCGDGNPARACIFVGDHTPTPGGGNSWVPGETWKFISKL